MWFYCEMQSKRTHGTFLNQVGGQTQSQSNKVQSNILSKSTILVLRTPPGTHFIIGLNWALERLKFRESSPNE